MQTSLIRNEPSQPTRLPKRCWETVTALCRFTAQGVFMPSSSLSTTSEGTPRIVDVIGGRYLWWREVARETIPRTPHDQVFNAVGVEDGQEFFEVWEHRSPRPSSRRWPR